MKTGWVALQLASRAQGRVSILLLRPGSYRGPLPRQELWESLPHNISRHAHPKAKPETPEPEKPPQTGIDYLTLTAAAHHEQLRRDERIGYHALYSSSDDGQIPDQLSIDDVVGLDPDGEVLA
jgi:hypothetical protein